MLRVMRLPSWAGIFILVGLLALVLISLPLFLFASGVFVLVSMLRSALMIKAPVNVERDGVSSVIKNKKIGAYRIKADENDPSVIEVIDP
jgi:hypothetical protein